MNEAKKLKMRKKKKCEKTERKDLDTLFGKREKQRRENNCGRHFIPSRFNNAR